MRRNQNGQPELLDEEQNGQEEEEQEESQSQQIYHSGSVTPEGGRHKIHGLTIIGQVEGHYIPTGCRSFGRQSR